MEAFIGSGQLTAILGVMVAIFSVLMPVAIVFVVLHFRQRRATEVLATVRHLAEKGLPVPTELLRPTNKAERRANDPRSMLIGSLSTLGAGVGLMIFFYSSGFLRFLWGIGALVAIVGIAQLIGQWLMRKQPYDDVGADAG